MSRGPQISAEYYAMYGERPDEQFPLPATDLSGSIRAGCAARWPIDARAARHRRHRYRQQLPLSRPRERPRHPLRHRRRQAGHVLAWPCDRRPQGRLAALDPHPSDDRPRSRKNGPWAGGMPAGLGNPLGARALYLYQGGRDTLYRIHGTNEPWSIGEKVSSGCIRMFNRTYRPAFACPDRNDGRRAQPRSAAPWRAGRIRRVRRRQLRRQCLTYGGRLDTVIGAPHLLHDGAACAVANERRFR